MPRACCYRQEVSLIGSEVRNTKHFLVVASDFNLEANRWIQRRRAICVRFVTRKLLPLLSIAIAAGRQIR